MAFASNTTVSVEKTKAALETLVVRKNGASGYMSGFFGLSSGVQFVMKNRLVRFSIEAPTAKNFTRDKKGVARSAAQIAAAVDQEERRLWRCLLLGVRAKLEFMNSGISTFEDEFLSNIVDPETGRTVGEAIKPMLAQSYGGDRGKLLLTGPTSC